MDNAPSHTAMAVQQFLAEKKITLMPQPPYTPRTLHRVTSGCSYLKEEVKNFFQYLGLEYSSHFYSQ
jgi:hypothetical protein